MPLTSALDKTRKDLERTISELDKTPLYAVVGAGDLAVAKLRDVRGELNARAAKLDPHALRDQTEASVAASIESVQSVPTKAQGLLGEVIASAFTTYDELAGRGKSLVTRVRRQQSTADLQEQATSTVARAKATATTVKKQTRASKKSASATTSTAKKSASRAKSSAKATTTSAKKTASATKKASNAAAIKVGR